MNKKNISTEQKADALSYVNPHAAYPTSIKAIGKSIFQNSYIIRQLLKRQIAIRYHDSILGIFWSLIRPILMLCVYTFAFSFIFKARWGGAAETRTQFAVILFVGLIIHGFFSDICGRSPTLIPNNVNYVKKMIFPLEILSIASVGGSLFQVCVNIAVLIPAIFLITGTLHWTILFIPLVLLPFVILMLGFSWILVSAGVFLRDVSHAIQVTTPIFLFISPVFYSLKSIPEKYRAFMFLNPLTFIIEQSRAVLILGHPPSWTGLFIYSIIACIFTSLSFAWFQKVRKGFADVI